MSDETSINLRLPKNLKDELKDIADTEKRSLNKQIVHILFRFILDYRRHRPNTPGTEGSQNSES